MKDYLNSDETNRFLIIRYIHQYTANSILENWTRRKNLTKDESRFLKMARTYLKKFDDALCSRLQEKELHKFEKRLESFKFTIVDDFHLKKLKGQWEKELGIVKMKREEFEDWCEQIMDIKCSDCAKAYKDCKLHDVFMDNFVHESDWRLKNCRYAYRSEKKEKGGNK